MGNMIKRSFLASGKENFRDLMIQYWMESEDFSKEEAVKCYGGKDFDLLCERVTGKVRQFTFDTETEVFESVDNNFVLPLAALNLLAIDKIDTPAPTVRTTKRPEVEGVYWVKMNYTEHPRIIHLSLRCCMRNIEWRSVNPIIEPEWGPIDG